MPVTNLNRTPLGYQIDGTGTPVVLVHGSWTDRRTWGPLSPPSHPRFKSSATTSGAMARAPATPTERRCMTTLPTLPPWSIISGLHRPIVVANSYGSNIALRFAAAHPDLAAGLVCHEPGLFDLLESTPAGPGSRRGSGRTSGNWRGCSPLGDLRATAKWYVDREFGPGTFDSFDDAARDRMFDNTPTVLRELEGSRLPPCRHRRNERLESPSAAHPR